MNIFDNPRVYLNEILENVRINKINKLEGKSFICAFFTKRCRAGCKFCFFKSNNKCLKDIEESYEMSEVGFNKFLKFVEDSNNGYLMLSGGGEPFEKSDYVIRTIASAKTERIVVVTNGIWAKKYDDALEMINKIHDALESREKKIPVVLRLSFDMYHYKNLGEDLYKNIISIFEKYYSNDQYLKLRIHTLMNDDTISKFALKYGYKFDNNFEYNLSDNDKTLKVMPQKFKMFINEDYFIDISGAKLFYPTVTPNLNEDINTLALDVFDEDLKVSESYNPARVTNFNSSDGLDFWINYNGNVTTWQNEQKEKIYNLYVDDYNTVVKETYNNILSYSVVDKGYYYRENIINEVNEKAVLRCKLSNMRDLSTALLLNESKTNLYYAIRVIKDYMSDVNFGNISEILRKVINLSKEELIDLFNKSDYSILDEYVLDDCSEIEWRDLFDVIRMGEYNCSVDSIQKGINYFNEKFGFSYKSIDDIDVIDKHNQNDRIIEKLTRMKREAKDSCLFKDALVNNS